MKVWNILKSPESLEESMARFYDTLRLHYAADAAVADFLPKCATRSIATATSSAWTA